MKTSLLSSSVCLGVEGSTSCLGASPPQGQRSFWETFPPQQKSCLQGQRDKSESQVPPAAAAVPRTASPQRQESAGQEKSTNASPPHSFTKKGDCWTRDGNKAPSYYPEEGLQKWVDNSEGVHEDPRDSQFNALPI
ncbi:hypothetical protein IRJ41_012844 [Triplophysa rosa]|uniref:Uncharacterized protein n=1 Tax=Triplophysa rosa TaxID=992332 RepID=A0A9W8C988_TRIRA|nr:hypothetical protein IRJ41_012844 [Triplophysa rosa]